MTVRLRRSGTRGLGEVVAMAGLAAAATACGPSRPPADFAPDPGLVARMVDLQILPAGSGVCPGRVLRTSYVAVLDDGTRVPFSTEYDEDAPPPLHVVMLRRVSPDAVPMENGDWIGDSDPLPTAMSGFRLSAFLEVKPSLNASVVVAPEYDCARRQWEFVGAGGERGAAGGNGPDVTVRVGILASPFHQRVLVAGIEVGVAEPFYVMADAASIPPADWLRVASRGGRGGNGVRGRDGADGADGEAGCPGGRGGAGGAGGNGGPGGTGGRGGRITVVAPEDEPFLAGIVDARNPGGRGGSGGTGGDGGHGGKGGEAARTGDRRCAAGADGADGPNGADGADGSDGPPGPPVESLLLPWDEAFGYRIPPALAALVDYTRGQ